jgi:hypothetical protein
MSKPDLLGKWQKTVDALWDRLDESSTSRNDDYMECHPTMQEAIEMFRRKSCPTQK